MASSTSVISQMEELRRRLHQGLGSSYDPARLQALAPISEEFDRLAVEVARRELEHQREALKRS